MNLFNLYFLISEAQERTHTAKIAWLVWLIFFIVFIFVSFLFCFIFNGIKKQKKMLKIHQDTNVRIYTYNYAKQTFYYFDKMNLKNAKQLSYDQFFAQFTPSDKYLVQDWLRSIAHNDEHKDFIQADIRLSKERKIANTMWEFNSVNRQMTTIHFTSYLLSHIYQANPKNRLHPNDRILPKYLLNNLDDAKKYLQKGSPDFFIATFYFRIYRKAGQQQIAKDTELEEINKKVLLQLSHFLTKTKKLMIISPYDEVILDVECFSKVVAMTFASTVHTYVQQMINNISKENEFNVALGISLDTSKEREPKTSIEQAEKMVDAITSGLAKDSIMFYDETFFTNYKLINQQKEEVKMLIKNSTFQNYFMPTLNIINKKKDFYIVYTKPYGTMLENFDSVIRVSNDIKQANKLYEALINKIYKYTNSHKEKLKFAINVPFKTLSSFIKATTKLKKDNVSWIVILSEIDIATSIDDATVISKTIHDYVKNGYEFGLSIESPTSRLRSRIIKTMSYFFIPPSLTISASDDARGKTDLRNIQTTYANYKVPFVYQGLKDFDDIELGVYFGGTIFQCDELALPSSQLENIDESKIEKICSETKNLGPNTLIQKENK